jgi:23S rRNA pseudouridine2605 synthase
MESNRRPGKGAPKKNFSTDHAKSSSRPKKKSEGRSESRPAKSGGDYSRSPSARIDENSAYQPNRVWPSDEDRPRRSSSTDRPPRKEYNKSSSEDRPRKISSTERPVRRESSSEDRPRRTSSTERPARRESSSEDRPRRTSSTERPARRESSSEDRPRRSSSTERPARRESSSEERPRRSSSTERPARREYGSEGRSRTSSSNERPTRMEPFSEDRPRRSSLTDHPPRHEYGKPGSEDRPQRSNSRSSNSPSGEGLIRLNKYIANSGICSRREADELIAAGTVMVNGKVVTELGTKVSPSDKVQYDDHIIRSERHVYVLLNKPKGYITTTEDPFDRKTVMTLVENACKERIYPVGRLDRNTTGLLLLTNDGDMAKKLTHPRHKVKKVYQVELDKPLAKNDMLTIAAGIELDDGMAVIDEISYTSEGASKKEIGVELHSGKNRIVRRVFEAVGYEVVKLDRVVFAGLTKKDLPRGHFRFLTEQEVNYLKMLK